MKLIGYLFTVWLLQRALEINTKSMDQLRIILFGVRSQHSRRLAAHHESPRDERQDALPSDQDCRDRRRPAVRARTRLDRRAHRPTTGRSWYGSGRDRAPDGCVVSKQLG